MSKRLRSEAGIALPMALGIMLVLTISVFAVIGFSSAGSRNASLNMTRQSAKALAEGGVNHGASVLAKTLQTNGAFAANLGGTAAIQGVNVPWTATYETGSSPRSWLVSATTALPNPTGPGASDVPRTVQARFAWTIVPDYEAWKGLYLANQGDVPLMSDDDASIAIPVYVRGGIKITQGKYLGSSFVVYGKLTLEGSPDVTSIGASARPGMSWKSTFPAPLVRTEHRVPDFLVKDGCATSTSGPWTAATCNSTSLTGGATGKIWLPCPTSPCSASNITSTAFSATVPDIPKPPVDFPARRLDADLGPNAPCQVATGSPPSFTGSDIELMPGSAYTCRRDGNGDGTIDGELNWVPGVGSAPGALTVKGVIYFDRNLKFEGNRWGKVNGKAVVYVNETVLMKGTDAGLCGVPSGTRPKCDNTDGVWDPGTTNDLVTFVAGSSANTAIDQTDFQFQGGFYAVGGYLLQGDAAFKGPIVADKAELKNSGLLDAWAPINTPIGGLPGNKLSLAFVPGSWNS